MDCIIIKNQLPMKQNVHGFLMYIIVFLLQSIFNNFLLFNN